MNKYVYPLGLWTYLPHRIHFTSKIVLIQFSNGSFYILFKQPAKHTEEVEAPGDWLQSRDLDWFSEDKLQEFEDEQMLNFQKDLEMKRKFNGGDFNLFIQC